MQAKIAPIRPLLVLIVTLAVAACATSPTGRSQLKLYSGEKLAHMGNQSYQRLLAKKEETDNEARKRFAHCVVDALGHVTEIDWRVTVFESDKVNAFAIPGGNIGIYAGLLDVTENAAQLAAVIGHEMGHVIAGHANERMSRKTITGLGVSVLSAAIGSQTGGFTQRQLTSLLGMGAKVGLILPFTRTQESEADRIGLRLMAAAGFDPREAVDLWRNMMAAGGASPPEFLSTHPSDEARIKHLKKYMNQALVRYRNSPYDPQCQAPDITTNGSS